MISASFCSLVGPTQNRSPPGVSTSSSSTFSTVLPASIECGPHELLPIMPPSVQRLCVAGSGPQVSPCFSASAFSASHTIPGSTSAVLASGSIDSTRFRCCEQSIIIALLTVWPFCEVPPPRINTGTAYSRQTFTVVTMSSILAGKTTPSGTCR